MSEYKLISLIEDRMVHKAGFVPYFVEDGVVKMMFMISSDAKFGGADPMLSKGHIDDGEDVKAAAFREAEEELGLKLSNVKPETIRVGWIGRLRGLKETYTLAMYLGEVKSQTDFLDPHYETEAVVWLTLNEFIKKGRRSQHKIVSLIASKIDHGLQ